MACYLCLITMGEKNVVLIYVTKWINIKNILSEKTHIEKATQIPYSRLLYIHNICPNNWISQ